MKKVFRGKYLAGHLDGYTSKSYYDKLREDDELRLSGFCFTKETLCQVTNVHQRFLNQRRCLKQNRTIQMRFAGAAVAAQLSTAHKAVCTGTRFDRRSSGRAVQHERKGRLLRTADSDWR